MTNRTVVLLYLLGFSLVFIITSSVLVVNAKANRSKATNLSAKLDHMHNELTHNFLHTKSFLVHEGSSAGLAHTKENASLELKKNSNKSLYAMVDEILIDPVYMEDVDHGKLSDIKDQIYKHTSAFDWIASRLIEKGGESSGILGSINSVSKMLRENPLLAEVSILELRNCEKDFLLTGEEKYIAKFKELLAKTRVRIQRAAESTSKTAAIELLAAYQKDFDRLVRIGQETGVRTNSGRYAQMIFWEDKLFAIIDDLRRDSEKLYENVATYNQRALGFYCSFMVIAAFLFSRMIASSLEDRFEVAKRTSNPVEPLHLSWNKSA